jgi:hypothetical protein
MSGACRHRIAALFRWGRLRRVWSTPAAHAVSTIDAEGTEKATPRQGLFGIPLLALAVFSAGGVPGQSRAEVYTGTCACDEDSETDSCHAQQTVSGRTIEELSQVCLDELGQNARIVAGSVRAEPPQEAQDASYPDASPDRNR